MPVLGARLGYNEEVHQMVKKIRPKTRLFEAIVGMAEKMERTIQTKQT
jgi:hypothetical protein